MFTDPPCTPAKLAKRLLKYRFWDRKSLNASIAANAVLAAKQIARQPKVTTVLPKLQSVVDKQDDRQHILERMYQHASIQSLTPQIWPQLLILRPKPKFNQSLAILKGYYDQGGDPHHLVNAIAGLTRSEIGRSNFLECFKLMKFYSTTIVSGRLLGGASCCAIGVFSGILWMESWPLASILGIFWLGLASAFLRDPVYPRVEWAPSVSLLYKLQHDEQIRLANQIVTGFEELGSVNIANYHLQRPRDTGANMESDLDTLLKYHGMQRRQMREIELYADYWSMDHHRWQQVEWHEPDQDPALLESKRPIVSSKQ